MEEVEVDLEQAFWPKAAHLSSISGAYHHFSSAFGLVENLQQVFSLRPAQLICTAWPKCITVFCSCSDPFRSTSSLLYFPTQANPPFPSLPSAQAVNLRTT